MARLAKDERDSREIRRLLKKAGGTPELLRWIDEEQLKPPPRRGGRMPGAVSRKRDDDLLPMLGSFCRVAERERGLKPHAAIRWLVAAMRRNVGRDAGLGESDDAATRRLYQKMKAGKFRELVLPPGITLKPLDDVD